MKIIIMGGVAAGASAAARLRRLDENAEIVLLERGEYISYANCGLPYHIGGVIPERESLLVMKPEKFQSWFHIDVRVRNEVTAIDPQRKTVSIRKPDGTTVSESYDKLLIATGSSPAELKIPGAEDHRIHHLWTIPDMDAILSTLKQGAKRAIVAGGGFIGIETAENLRKRGLEVTIIQRSGHLLPTLDPEMAVWLAQELNSDGIRILFHQEITEFKHEGEKLIAVLKDGIALETDLAVMSTGVKPNSELAAAAGLKTGARGHISVDEYMQTSDPHIYAAGDVVEIVDPITGNAAAIPLAGPANKQGRIAADNILAGNRRSYRGTYGASVIQCGSMTAATVGLNEEKLRKAGLCYHKIYTHPGSNAGYYPTSAQMHLKLLFAEDGRILGAQAVGIKGADKRIDVIASAMRNGATAPELAELELAYAPPFNSAKDPVNFLGMIARNVLDRVTIPAYADDLPPDALILDVREKAENELGAIPGAVNMPLGEIRSRMNGLDKTKEIITACQVGLRGYLAERILRQNGFKVRNLSGGYLTWKAFHPAPLGPAVPPEAPANRKEESAPTEPVRELDVRALACPGPVVRLKQKMEEMKEGDTLRLLAPLTFASDLQAWSDGSGNPVLSLGKKPDYLEAVLRKSGGSPATENIPVRSGHGCAIVLFSNDLDKALAALIIACGMAASGAKVGIFFTFWGLSVLRKNPAPEVGKNPVSRMFGWMLPKGASKLSLSKMNMGGMGTSMMKQIMKKQNVLSLPELLQQARSLGVRFVACEMAMNVMGITREELIEVDDVAGVASFVAMAKESSNTLFI